MADYRISTDKSWAETHAELGETMGKWGVRSWAIDCAAPPRQSLNWGLPRDMRAVELRFLRGDRQVTLFMDKQQRPVDNLRVLYLVVEGMRMNERRGMGEIIASAYLQLEGPKGTHRRDPYEVLGIRPDAPLEVAEASYRALAKAAHPDAGGSTERMQELNDALASVRTRATA